MSTNETTEMTTMERGIGRVITTPPPAPGFIGEGHTAVPVVDPADFARNDPFIVLMDDRVDLAPGRKAGDAHPHAGFEIATFLLEGELRDRDEGVLRAGDVMWTTAGSGVIHNEDVEPHGATRILQLWFTLPSKDRWAAPRLHHMRREDAPVRREPGVEARVYSGSSGAVTAAAHTYLLMTMVDVRLDAGATFDQELPGSYNGFIYVLEGDVDASGSPARRVASGQVAWLADAERGASTVLRLRAGDGGARFVLYAGERQGVPIVMHGPFVAETRSDLMRISREFMEGRLPRISEVAK